MRSILQTSQISVLLTKGTMTLLARVPPSSDFACWHYVIEKEQYKPLVEVAVDDSHRENVKVVVDLGANVGYATQYFLEAFPDAHIYAVEPDAENLAVFILNLGNEDRVSVTRGAVWSESTALDLMTNFRDGKEWAYQTVESEDGEVEGHTLDEICPGEIDVLKMDIEGSEFEVFKNPEFLKRVKVLGIEIHHECGDAEIIYSALRKYGFSFCQIGEVTVCVRR